MSYSRPLANFKVRIVFAPDVNRPPAVPVVRQGAGTYCSEAVVLAEVFYLDGDGHLLLF